MRRQCSSAIPSTIASITGRPEPCATKTVRVERHSASWSVAKRETACSRGPMPRQSRSATRTGTPVAGQQRPTVMNRSDGLPQSRVSAPITARPQSSGAARSAAARPGLPSASGRSGAWALQSAPAGGGPLDLLQHARQAVRRVAAGVEGAFQHQGGGGAQHLRVSLVARDRGAGQGAVEHAQHGAGQRLRRALGARRLDLARERQGEAGDRHLEDRQRAGGHHRGRDGCAQAEQLGVPAG
jgi:hypothetical protein